MLCPFRRQHIQQNPNILRRPTKTKHIQHILLIRLNHVNPKLQKRMGEGAKYVEKDIYPSVSSTFYSFPQFLPKVKFMFLPPRRQIDFPVSAFPVGKVTRLGFTAIQGEWQL